MAKSQRGELTYHLQALPSNLDKRASNTSELSHNTEEEISPLSAPNHHEEGSLVQRK